MANAFAAGGEGLVRGDIGDDDQPFGPGALRGEVEKRRVVGLRVLARAETRLEEAGAPGPVEPGEQREIATLFGGDAQILAHADREGDIGIVEEFDPIGADELAIRQQKPDARGREMREMTPQQRDPGRGRAVARALEQGPEQRNPEAPGDDREHEVVHVVRPDLPVGPVERERPAARRSDQARDDRNRPVRSEIHMLEEPLRPAAGRGDQNASPPFGGDMAEIDGARADHAHDEHAQRLHAAPAEPDMASQRPGEGGNGLMRHGTILATESSRRTDPAALSQPCVV